MKKYFKELSVDQSNKIVGGFSMSFAAYDDSDDSDDAQLNFRCRNENCVKKKDKGIFKKIFNSNAHCKKKK